MKINRLKIILTLLNLVIINIVFCQTESSFVRKQPLGNEFVSRSEAGLIEFNNHLYIYGGNSNANIHDFAKYNLATNELTKLDKMPTTSTNLVGKSTFKVGDYMYHFSSQGTGVSRYNLLTDTWEVSIMSMASVVPDAGFVIDSIVYLTSSATGSNSFWAFDTTNLTWTQKSNYPGASGKRGAFAFVVDGKGYYGGGRNYQNNGCTGNTSTPGCYFNFFYEYNPQTDTWTQKADFPISIVGAVGAGVGNKGYVGLGSRQKISPPYDQEVNSSLWYEYDPQTDIWSVKQNFMNFAAIDFYSISNTSITTLGSDIFVFGGNNNSYSSSHSTDNLYKYDTLTDTWSIIDSKLGGNRIQSTGVFINGKLYAGGGNDHEALMDFYEYNPQNDSWQKKANCPILQFSDVGATSIGNKGYFVGGYHPEVAYHPNNVYSTNKFYEYDALSDVWSEKADYPGGERRSMVVESYNGEVYAGFGFKGGGGFIQSFYKYTPSSDTWTALSLPTFSTSFTSGFFASSFVIGDNLYLVVHNNIGSQDRMQKYSFTNNTWTPIPIDLTGLIINQRVDMAFSYNGKGYLIFDETTAFQSMKKLMEYNPDTNSLSFVSKIPFYVDNQLIVEGNDGVYFAFGTTIRDEAEIAGYPKSNQVWKWNPQPAISTETGLYTVQNNTASCDIKFSANQHTLITDNMGDLFLKLQGGSQLTPVCLEVNSVGGNYRELQGDFGTGTTTAFFANKSFLQKSNQIGNDNTVRIYFTDQEINDFVNNFNSNYQENKTINDIKIISHYDFNNPSSADHDPLNNLFFATNNPTQSLYKILNPTIGNYGNGKYFEVVANATNSNLRKEVYVVLFSESNLSISEFQKNEIKIYPNPVSNELTIEMENFDYLIIMDLFGKELLKKHENVIYLSDFSSGIYFVSIIDKNGIKTVKKIIKQ
jgi:N-acetylneuraminic acid mutarotase